MAHVSLVSSWAITLTLTPRPVAFSFESLGSAVSSGTAPFLQPALCAIST